MSSETKMYKVLRVKINLREGTVKVTPTVLTGTGHGDGLAGGDSLTPRDHQVSVF